jgi:signal transduction histidine kinase
MRALSLFRAATLLWAIGGVLLSTEHLASPGAAAALIGLMVVTTLLLTLWPRRGAALAPMALGTIIFEISIGALVLLADGLVFEASRPQSLPWAWPAAGVMAAGIVFGTRAGLIAAAVTGAASLAAEVLLLERFGTDGTGIVGAVSKLGLWVLAGALAGYVVNRLRRAEAQISVVRAREEFSRQLHDGVLQTLAVIQRRSDDSELSALARDQEHELRSYLSGSVDAPAAFEPEMRRLAAKHESLHGGRVNIVIAPDLPELNDERRTALSGAIGEALTNAGKHGNAQLVTIYAEPTDEEDVEDEGHLVFVSVKDNGDGFDPDTTDERIGMSRSIRGRITEHGGRVDVRSRPGRGTEVQFWI